MNKYIGCCGLNCKECEAYIATINNDDNLRKIVARKWSKLNNVEIKETDINCLGCRNDGVKTIFCSSLCQIKNCCNNRKYQTCGECNNLDNCSIVKMITSDNIDAYKRLKENKEL